MNVAPGTFEKFSFFLAGVRKTSFFVMQFQKLFYASALLLFGQPLGLRAMRDSH
jgi:hypothetical protein